MRIIQDREILNLTRFKSDNENLIVNRDIRLTTNIGNNIGVDIRPVSFEQFTSEILKIAKTFPHRKCALTYTIDDRSKMSVEICPVTETA